MLEYAAGLMADVVLGSGVVCDGWSGTAISCEGGDQAGYTRAE